MSRVDDERPHRPGPEPGWCESWYVDFADDAGRGGFLRLTLHPGSRTAWLWAAWVDTEGFVLVRDHEVPVPRNGMEVRSSGLWADLTCETPLVHWTFGLEAFGVALDDPSDALHGERGHRTPLGFDLEWEALIVPFDHPGASSRPHEGHYQHAGRVHGEVLVGDATIEFDGTGERDRWWGPRSWWDLGWHWSAFRLGPADILSVARPDRPGAEHATGYRSLDGGDPHPVVRAEVETEWSGAGLPVRARYRFEDGLEVGAEVVAHAPLMIPGGPAGLTSHLPRALCRFTSERGGGTGWAEWLRTG